MGAMARVATATRVAVGKCYHGAALLTRVEARLARLREGRCPTHGTPLYAEEPVWQDDTQENLVAVGFQCPRRDCPDRWYWPKGSRYYEAAYGPGTQ